MSYEIKIGQRSIAITDNVSEVVAPNEQMAILFKGMANICKRTARTVLTGMCYSVGSVMRQGSSSLTRLTGQSAMTSRTWRR